MKIILSRAQWELIGQKTGWIKTAEYFLVDFNVGWSGPRQKVRTRIDPDTFDKMDPSLDKRQKVEEIVKRRLTRQYDEDVIINSVISVGGAQEARRDLIKSLREEQRQKRMKQRELERAKRNPQEVTMEDLAREVEKTEDDVNLLDVLNSRKKVQEEKAEIPEDADILELLRRKKEVA